MPCAETPPLKAMRFTNIFECLQLPPAIPIALALLLFVITLPISAGAEKEAGPSYSLKLVNNLNERSIQKNFDCRERVYLLASFFKVYGKHRVTARWFNPEGQLQDEGYLDFVGQEEETAGWLALEFLNVKEQAASAHLNAAAARFYGKWKVRLFLDNRFLEEQDFFVRCR